VMITELASGASCGSATITSQSDAYALVAACPTVNGDVTLATNASGTINLDGLQSINGNLASEICSNSCGAIASLSSATLISISQNISLIGLSNLTNVALPKLQTVGEQFYLDSLSSLNELSVPKLTSVGQFHLGTAPNLTSMNLTQLQNVTGQNPSVEIFSVGLLYFQNLNVNTNLSSFILRDTPNSEGLDLDIPTIDYLEIQPGGTFGKSFSFSTSTGATFVSRVGTLNMSGCDGFDAAYPTTYDTMILSQNSFETLYLNPVKILNNLSIINNGNLNSALLPTDMSIPNIEISGNGVFSQELIAGTDSWPWGIKNVSTMILDGFFVPDFL
jgi:hypothetical protein